MMQHTVLLGRDSWVRFDIPSYSSLPPRPLDHLFFGEVECLTTPRQPGIAALRYKPRCVGWRLRPSLRWRRRRQMGRCGSTLISAALPLIQRGNGLRLTWKLAALSGPSNAFEATSEAPSFASCRTIRRSKALVKWEITMCEPSGGSSFLPYSTTPSSTPSASPTEIPFPVSFARVCHRTRPH